MIYNFLSEYLSIFIFLFIALFLSIGFIIANYLASPSNPDPEKLSAYECGFEPFDDSRMEFDVRFYLVAILFIIFDLEINRNASFCPVHFKVKCYKYYLINIRISKPKCIRVDIDLKKWFTTFYLNIYQF